MNSEIDCQAKAREFESIHGQAALIDRFCKFDIARPYPSVIGLAVDNHGRFPIFYRTAAVRSARNAWSMPSGLHEAGRSVEAQFSTELAEELNLKAIPGSIVKVGFYENIVFDKPDEPNNWHWVNLLVAVAVETLECIRNMEPEKHSGLTIVTLDELFDRLLDEKQQWTPGLREALLEHDRSLNEVVSALSFRD